MRKEEDEKVLLEVWVCWVPSPPMLEEEQLGLSLPLLPNPGGDLTPGGDLGAGSCAGRGGCGAAGSTGALHMGHFLSELRSFRYSCRHLKQKVCPQCKAIGRRGEGSDEEKEEPGETFPLGAEAPPSAIPPVASWVAVASLSPPPGGSSKSSRQMGQEVNSNLLSSELSTSRMS
jgi:hypothetical protein